MFSRSGATVVAKVQSSTLERKDSRSSGINLVDLRSEQPAMALILPSHDTEISFGISHTLLVRHLLGFAHVSIVGDKLGEMLELYEVFDFVLFTGSCSDSH